jgi:hypothetical protein
MYKKMKKHAGRGAQEAKVVVGSSGMIYLNSFAMHQFFEGVRHVSMLFDGEARKLAIQPAKETDEDIFRLNFSNNSKSTGVIAARSVARQLPIDYKTTKFEYAGTWNQKLGALEIDLKSRLR